MRREYSTHDEKEKYIILTRKLKRRDFFGRHRHRWVDNIKVDLKERSKFVDRIHVAENGVQ
jgi:hypothetical protein